MKEKNMWKYVEDHNSLNLVILKLIIFAGYDFKFLLVTDHYSGAWTVTHTSMQDLAKVAITYCIYVGILS